MTLINLLMRELNNCSLGGDFRVSRHAEICQFYRFSLEINFKKARSCNYFRLQLQKDFSGAKDNRIFIISIFLSFVPS